MTRPVAVVTGANSGVGFEAARLLARAGNAVILVCRNVERGEAARRRIADEGGDDVVRLEIADLSSLSQVRDLAVRLSAGLDRLELLVNNAGVYRARREITEDGFERTMAVNHLAHFLLTLLLADRLERARGRVVTVSSEAHRGGRLGRGPLEDILRGRGTYSGFRAYADSKLANVLFTRELAARYGERGIVATAVHPGTLATRIWNQNRDVASLAARLVKPFMGRPRAGGEAVVHAAGFPAQDAQGAYFNRLERVEPSSRGRDPLLARELWETSAGLTEARAG